MNYWKTADFEVNPKKAGGSIWFPSPMVFSNMCFPVSVWSHVFFVTFNIIISHIFPKNCIEVPQIVPQIKENNDVRI